MSGNSCKKLAQTSKSFLNFHSNCHSLFTYRGKMSKKYVICDPDKCLGCQICEFVCSAAKEKSCDPLFSRIRVVNSEPLGSMAISCVLCEKAPCVQACLTRALFKDEKGVVAVDEKKCIGCGWCIERCKFGAISLHPSKKVVAICDLCNGEPKCVKFCPFDAISYATVDDVAHKFRKDAMVQLLQELASKA